MIEKAFDVRISAMAFVSGSVIVQIDTEGKSEEEIQKEAEAAGKEKALSGDIIWRYNGIDEGGEILITDVSES